MGWCGGIVRTDFEQFLLWKGVEVGVVVLKELILNSYYCGQCGGIVRTDFEQFSTLEGCEGRCGGLERTDFEQFLLWDGVVGLKELIVNSFYLERVWR